VRAVRQPGLRVRATLAWALIALVLSVGLTVLAYQLTRAELMSDRQDRANSQAYLNARLLRSGLRSTTPDMSDLLSSLEGNAGSRVIARRNGQWYAGSVGASADDLPSSLRDVVRGGTAGRQRTDIDGLPFVAVGVPIAEASAEYYELVALDDVDGALGALAVGLAVGALAATALAALAGWYASGQVLRPLRRMANASTGIAEGRLHTRLDAFGDPDLMPIQTSFNRMVEAVEHRIEREHRFTSDVSHELRSPLAAMLSSIEIARAQSRDPEAVDEALAHLHRRTDAFHQLVNDLLEISRVDAGQTRLEIEPIEPGRLVGAVLDMTGSTGLVVDVADDAPEVVQADKRRLGRMVMNLVENADRYAGGATRIAVTRDGAALRITVDDEGPGIPEHERRHVLGRFARGEHARASTTTGTGLGLALVDEHARLHGGRVLIDAAPGGGTRVVIEIPIEGPPS